MKPESPAIFTAGNSYPQVFDGQFLLQNAASVVCVLPEFKGCCAELIGFSPFRSEISDDGAHVLVLKSKCGKKACIGMNFGAVDRRDERRRPVNPDFWKLYDDLHYHAGISFCSWDEVWAFVCLLGEQLCVSEVRLRYGI